MSAWDTASGRKLRWFPHIIAAISLVFCMVQCAVSQSGTGAPAQDAPRPDHDMSGVNMDMPDHPHKSTGMTASEMFFMGESSGTAVQPSAWPMPMVMTNSGSWQLLWMGQAFLVSTQQTGPLGADKLLSLI